MSTFYCYISIFGEIKTKIFAQQLLRNFNGIKLLNVIINVNGF